MPKRCMRSRGFGRYVPRTAWEKGGLKEALIEATAAMKMGCSTDLSVFM
jgi:hypothetical protein